VTWNARVLESTPTFRRLQLFARACAHPITWSDVLELWPTDDFAQTFARTLADVPYRAFFWETPPVTVSSLDRPFECVLIDSPQLARITADPSPFAAHFAATPNADIVTFANLGGDATLIVPCPRDRPGVYPHLATFVRQGPPTQVRALWRHLALAIRATLTASPLWVSTAGLGVDWLHLRLDSAPKYYRHRPYAV
jgi:hypothetical protein